MGSELSQGIGGHAPGLVAKQVAIMVLELGAGDGFATDVQTGNAGVTIAQRIQVNLGLQRHMEDRAHTGAHDFRVVGINTAGAEQAAQATEPGEGTQNGTEVAGVLHFVQVNRFFANR